MYIVLVSILRDGGGDSKITLIVMVLAVLLSQKILCQILDISWAFLLIFHPHESTQD